MAEREYFVQPAIPRFNGHYDHWSMLMENFLRYKEYWHIIETGISEPTTEAERSALTTVPKTELEQRRLKDLKAKNYLFQAIDHSILETILSRESAKEIWDSMKKKYQGTAKVKRAHLQVLRSEFETLRMKSGESVSDYFSRTMAIANKMRIHGDKIADVTIVEKILRSMNTKFDYVVCSIEESKYLDTLSLDELESSLLVREQRINQQDDAEHSLQLSITNSSKGRGSGRGRGRAHYKKISLLIFAGAFPENYEPPANFYFEVNDASPIVQDNNNLFDYNVQERVKDFVTAALSQANITRTNHIMWTMGTDFKYQYAHTWFREMDKLIHYVNMDGRVNALYSTPSIYTDVKYATKKQWPLKTEDFFPYADRGNAYWTGYFTSRPAFKRYVRMMSGYYLAARQLEFFKGRSTVRPNTDYLADALAIAQHHDAVTGTEKQHVADDYGKRLSIGYAEVEELVASSLACLVESTNNTSCGKTVTKFEQCPLLNISYCPPSEVDLPHGKNLVIVVYNSLGWQTEDIVRIPVSTTTLHFFVLSLCMRISSVAG